MNANEAVITVAAFLTALTAIFYFLRKLYKVAQRIDQALGVDKQGRTISERLDRVEHQLFPNGGSSLTDKINRIEKEQNSMQAQLLSLHSLVIGIIGGRKDGPTGAS